MNRDTYILKNVIDSQYSFILISKDMSRIQDYITSIEMDLRKLNTQSYILFDLLLNNNIEDRFYKCFFDGNKFALNTLSKVSDTEIDKKLIQISSNYYINNDYLFEDMFFSNDYKKHIFENLKSVLS